MSSPSTQAPTAEHKPFSLVEILIVLIIIALMSAMSLPVFSMIRNSAREKRIVNNLRQLDAAAQQYYLENGSAVAPYAALVGEGKYLSELKAIAGEDYSVLVLEAAAPEVSITVPKLKGGKVVTLRRPSADKDKSRAAQ